MPLVDLLMPTGSSPGKLGYAGQAQLVNCYAEALDRGKSQMSIVACDGYTSFATLADGGGIRAMLALSDSDLYVVAGRLVFRVDATGTATVLGGLPTDGPVSMARNRADPPQIAIVSDGAYYGITGGVLSRLDDPELPSPISVASVGGYFVFMLSSGQMFTSNLDDWDVEALNYATAEANPDGGVWVVQRGAELVALGKISTEFWTLTGDSPFPFAFNVSRNVGCLSGSSVAVIDDAILFVDHNGKVCSLEGYQARRISTHAIERDIEDVTDASTITATSWQVRGHTFYALSCADWTHVYDLSMGAWHNRRSKGLDRWRVGQVMRWGRKLIAGDYASGALYQMSRAIHSENQSELVMEIRAVPVSEFPRRIQHKSIHIDIVPGVGLTDPVDYALLSDDSYALLSDDDLELLSDGTASEADSDPILMLDWCDDGKVFGKEVHIPLGRVGQGFKQIKRHGFGSAHNRTYRLRVSAAVERMVLGAKIDASPMGTT